MAKAARHRPATVPAATLKRLLRQRFGLAAFRPGQEEVIRNVIAGVDTLAVMPTGAGKSLCYQLPGLLLPGTTVVVSPLIALMNDQADKLDEAGVDSALVNSTLRAADEADTMERIATQASEMVFVTPERLGTREVLEQLQRNPIDVFVIDEAHCISQWGHDFRPAFLEIVNALAALGDPPVLALTATATPEVADDIRRQLRRPQMAVVNASIYRPNLHYSVKQVTNEDEKLAALEHALERVRGTRLVYTATVQAAEALHNRLQAAGHDALLYHGRMRAKDRRDSQDRFMAAGDAVMVATNAFGMGIDKPDVRAVIHYPMPATLEAYYQESGRAGRDGAPAMCRLLFDASDKRIQTFFMSGRYPDADDIARAWRLLVESEGRALAAPDIPRMAGKGGVAKMRVALKALSDAGLVDTTSEGYAAGAQQLDATLAERVARDYRQRADLDRTKLEQLVAYAHSARCRWVTLLEYFGEAAPFEHCGVCDNCRHPAAPPVVAEAKAPRTTGAEEAPRDPLELGQRVTVPRYGAGTVTALAGDVVTIAFPDGQRRPFMRPYVQPTQSES